MLKTLSTLFIMLKLLSTEFLILKFLSTLFQTLKLLSSLFITGVFNYFSSLKPRPCSPNQKRTVEHVPEPRSLLSSRGSRGSRSQGSQLIQLIFSIFELKLSSQARAVHDDSHFGSCGGCGCRVCQLGSQRQLRLPIHRPHAATFESTLKNIEDFLINVSQVFYKF